MGLAFKVEGAVVGNVAFAIVGTAPASAGVFGFADIEDDVRLAIADEIKGGLFGPQVLLFVEVEGVGVQGKRIQKVGVARMDLNAPKQIGLLGGRGVAYLLLESVNFLNPLVEGMGIEDGDAFNAQGGGGDRLRIQQPRFLRGRWRHLGLGHRWGAGMG